MSSRTRGLAGAPAVLLVLLAMMPGGCGGLTQPYPEKQLYGIEPGTPPASASQPRAEVLGIRRVRVAVPYNQRSFVRKTGPTGYASDYYAGFIAMPDQLLTTTLVEWLTRSRTFTTAVDTGASIPQDLTLEGNVTRLEGDYTDPKSPRAVVAARFFVLRDTPSGTAVVMEKPYEAAVPVGNRSSEALAEGISKAYRQVLLALTADLAKLPAGTQPAGTRTPQ